MILNHLDKLVKWSDKWQVTFNFDKSKCLHLGQKNVNTKMIIKELGTTKGEEDLGALKVNRTSGLVKRNIE